jgi:hypothetical protein
MVSLADEELTTVIFADVPGLELVLELEDLEVLEVLLPVEVPVEVPLALAAS